MTDYTDRFLKIIPQVFLHEGGYVKNRKDPGGETKYGISKRSYPHLEIKKLTKAEATEIYYYDWWLKYMFELLPEPIGEKIFDLAINMGHRRSIRILQKALEPFYPNISIDGIMGPKTLKMSRKAPSQKLIKNIRKQAEAYYIRLVQAKPQMAIFLEGWLNRARF